ncbi:hypothetical protein WDU94_010764 [Cyamophila willieti]
MDLVSNGAGTLVDNIFLLFRAYDWWVYYSKLEQGNLVKESKREERMQDQVFEEILLSLDDTPMFSDLFPTTANTQYVANATCALAVNLAGIPFDTSNIDDILMTGDRLYQTVQACRERRRLTTQIYLDPEELVSVTHDVERRIYHGREKSSN